MNITLNKRKTKMNLNQLSCIDRTTVCGGVLMQYIDTGTDTTVFLLEGGGKQLEVCTVDKNAYIHIHTATDRDDVIGKFEYINDGEWEFSAYIDTLKDYKQPYISKNLITVELKTIRDLYEKGFLVAREIF